MNAGGKEVNRFARWSDDGLPWFSVQPMHGMMPCTGVGGEITLHATAASDYDFNGTLHYLWRHTTPSGTVDVTDGPHGACSPAGAISGATTDTLTITCFQTTDAGCYTLTVFNGCASGGVTSSAASVGLLCSADWNNSCTLEVQDIFDFLSGWFANCDGTVAGYPCFGHSADYNHVGGQNAQDIFDFLSDWFAGCDESITCN